MRHRRHEDPGGHQEDNSREEGVGGGEKLRRLAFEGVDWSHASKNHCGLENRIYPPEAADVVISHDADSQRDGDNAASSHSETPPAHQEGAEREQRLMATLEHGENARLLGLARRARALGCGHPAVQPG